MRLVFAFCALAVVGCHGFSTHDEEYAFPPGAPDAAAPATSNSPPLAKTDPFNTHLSRSKYAAIAAGDHYTCALRASGQLDCWGDRLDGQPRKLASIAAGQKTACGLDDQSLLHCWGAAGGFLDEPSGKLSDLGIGDGFACALDDAQHARCWGPNPLTPPAEDTFTSLAVGTLHACGLHADGTAVCWGNDLGGGDVPADKFSAVAAGPSTSCGIRIGDGAVVCWGLLEGLQPISAVSSIAVTKGKVCGIDKFSLHAVCAGLTPDDWLTPPADYFAQLSIGTTHACGIRAADSLAVCWGSDTDGESTPLD